MPRIQGSVGKPLVVQYNEKELFSKLDAYLDKDSMNELTSNLKKALDNIYKKGFFRRHTIVGTKTAQKVVGAKWKQPKPGVSKPDEEKQEGFVVNRIAVKTLDVNKAQDLAKASVYFLSGKRTGDKLNGYEYKYGFSAKKRKIFEILESEFMHELNPITSAVRDVDLSVIKKTIKGIDKSARKILALTALFTTLGIGTAMMGIYDQDIGFGLKPEVILGTVPLFSVQMIERAKSDRKLKNRALGDVFLAHQKGNKDILRVDLTLTGAYRFIYLAFLIQLQKEGMSSKKNIGLNPDAKVSLPSTGNYSGQLTNKKVLNYDVHNTFPIITRTAILFNMYLQTIEWHQSVDDGKGAIKVHLLFRKYFPTSAFKVMDEIWSEEEGGVIIGGSSMEVVEDYGMAKRWMEFVVDGIWKMTKLYGETHARMLVGADGLAKHEIDQQAVSSMEKLVTSYSGKFLGIL
jgi:hypothetical protein